MGRIQKAVWTFVWKVLDRLPEPRLSPYENVLDPFEAIAPLYVLGTAFTLSLVIFRDHSFWFGILNGIYFALSLWMLWKTPRWRYFFKRKLRGQVDLHVTGIGQNDVMMAMNVELANVPEGKGNFQTYQKAMVRGFYKSVEGLCYAQAVIFIDETPVNAQTGAPDPHANVRFTMWFNTVADAVAFKLRNVDTFDFVGDK